MPRSERDPDCYEGYPCEPVASLLADADAAVLDARCAEERMRVEAEQMRYELLRLRDIVCDEDAASIDRVIGEPAECDYPECEKCGERDTCADRYVPPDDGIPF